jgi:aconitate hydratase
MDHFGSQITLDTHYGPVTAYGLEKLEKDNVGQTSRLPFSIKVLLEAALRNCNDFDVTQDDVKKLANWQPNQSEPTEIPFKPGRVILQDFTGVPALVDLAAMRSAMKRLGGDPQKIEPLIPSDLVVDHSVQVDYFGMQDALERNMKREFERNKERYEFLKWGQSAFKKFKVIPPGVGIIHQVNVEYFARCVILDAENGIVAYPDSLVGTDSHTTMINGLGIVGWGVGGIEAEAVMLGQPIYMVMPEVVGFKLFGNLPDGATATDLVLRVVEILRKKGVVGKFVEFYGTGLSTLSLPDRATIANMGPEYGATMGFFPIDAESLNYLRRTGRDEALIDLVEKYTKTQGLFRTDDTPDPIFTDTVELDLSTIGPSLAGPKRPQDRITLANMQKEFKRALTAPAGPQGIGLRNNQLTNSAEIEMNGQKAELKNGSVVIAAITSCTNTSNPSVLLGAGILAKKAVERGLKVPPHVKTSLAPGSRVVTEYYKETGLDRYLDKLGFQTVGYGCTTCIGNSGPLPGPVANGIQQGDIVAASVLSGNRNFEGRVNPHTKANYLASPPLVVAYALAGTVDIDLTNQPIGIGDNGSPVFLKDIWPTKEELLEVLDKASNPETYKKMYADVNAFSPEWNDVPVVESDLYDWKSDSTYIQEPPFFIDLTPEVKPIESVQNARVLAMLGDTVTTDHISPAGVIPPESPAATFLKDNNVALKDFNSFGSRRGNDKVMVRGTFANIRLKNLLAPGTEGGVTLSLPSEKQAWIYDAAMDYKKQGVPLVILAGKDYGTGSSRDWAAKGTFLLGVKAVIAESFERIHRSNLVGMGVLPIQFKDGDSTESLGLTGHEEYSINLSENMTVFQDVVISAKEKNGNVKQFSATIRLDTPVEIKYYKNGGILQTVLRDMLK